MKVQGLTAQVAWDNDKIAQLTQDNIELLDQVEKTLVINRER